MKKTYIAPSVAIAGIELDEMVLTPISLGASTDDYDLFTADSNDRDDYDDEDLW